METKFVSFSGGSAILAPSTMFSPPSTMGYVSMKGMMFSTAPQEVNNESSQFPPPLPSAKSTDESRPRKPRREFQAVSSSTISISSLATSVPPQPTMDSSENSSVVIQESSDGALMFSTGS
jgi:hypothetical protein